MFLGDSWDDILARRAGVSPASMPSATDSTDSQPDAYAQIEARRAADAAIATANTQAAQSTVLYANRGQYVGQATIRPIHYAIGALVAVGVLVLTSSKGKRHASQ